MFAMGFRGDPMGNPDGPMPDLLGDDPKVAVKAALDDFIPESRDQAAIDHMTVLALDECRNRRLLPGNAEAIRREIEARRAARTA